MSPADRKAIGQKTWDECLEQGEAEYERQLQKDALNELTRRGIVVVYQRMDKRTRGRKGQPDHLFAVEGQAYGFEYKSATGKLSPQQEETIDRMRESPNDWTIKVIRSLPELIHELADLGL